MSKRLADFITPDETTSSEQLGAPEEVFTFPDKPQTPVSETVAQMIETVITGDPEVDPEDETTWAAAAQAPAPETGRIAAAFDRGAKLRLPEPPPVEPDPEVKGKRRQTTPRVRPSLARPAGSDEFTDLFAAGLITIIAFSLGDEFQPTEEEAKDLARPLGNILARRIDLAAKLGQDSNDVVAFAVAVMAYGVRVGPIAVERVRESYNDRQSRLRSERVSRQGLAPDDRGEGRVPDGSDVGASPSLGPARSAFDAVAQARDAQLRVVGRDLGRPSRGGAPVASNG